ncbi:MAG: hypothetical protein M3308_00310 [Actinomycetota bacterium]|nr:hypothetical protein [Actinomycetota bacterium]
MHTARNSASWRTVVQRTAAWSAVALLAAAVLAGCSREDAATPQPAGTEAASSSAPTSPVLQDGLLPAGALPPGPQYQMLTTVPDPGGLTAMVESVQPPECRRVLELVAAAAGEVDEVASVSGASRDGFVAIALLRDDDLFELSVLEAGLRACPSYSIEAGGARVQADQRVLPPLGLGAAGELHYISTITAPGAPPLQQASVVMRDGDVQISVNTAGVFTAEVAELARASLERKRDVLG